MQLKIYIKGINNINLPIAYHHIQQSAIYSLIRGNLHDQGYSYEKRDYKLFTFGPFSGKYTVKNHRIIFHDCVSFELRCLDDNVMNDVMSNIKKYGFRIGDISYHNIELDLADRQIESGQVSISMISPICVYETDFAKHTHYYSPKDEEFYAYIEDNYYRKYVAAYGLSPETEISIQAKHVNDRDKYFTKYKNFYIEAWKGSYILEGNSDGLNFLYNTGIGAKNSQGFGMFEII